MPGSDGRQESLSRRDYYAFSSLVTATRGENEWKSRRDNLSCIPSEPDLTVYTTRNKLPLKWNQEIIGGWRKILLSKIFTSYFSYKGSQIFEAVGLGQEVMDKCFTGTASRVSGVGFTILAQEALDRHRLAFSDRECDNVLINSKGAYHWRDGTCFDLYRAVGGGW